MHKDDQAAVWAAGLEKLDAIKAKKGSKGAAA
jgi:hypothetical protein